MSALPIVAFLAALQGGGASAALFHNTPGSGERWQVELSSKPGTCLCGKPNAQANLGNLGMAFLILEPCDSTNLHQHFDFVGPSGQIRWAAQPNLCLDEGSAGFVPCISEQRSSISRRQIFAFDAASNILVSGSRPDNCLRIDWDGAALNPCDGTDTWQQLRAIPIQGKLMRSLNYQIPKVTFVTDMSKSDTKSSGWSKEFLTSSGWTKSDNERKGALKIRGSQDRCLKGAESSCTGACETVNSGTCSTSEMRFFFHYSVTWNHTKFCVPSSGCTEPHCCSWTKCLEASKLEAGAAVKRKDCDTTGANTLQNWIMPVQSSPYSAYRLINIQGNRNLCLKLKMSGSYPLQMRNCADETGYEKYWKMPYEPATTTTTTTTTTTAASTTTTSGNR